MKSSNLFNLGNCSLAPSDDQAVKQLLSLKGPILCRPDETSLENHDIYFLRTLTKHLVVLMKIIREIWPEHHEENRNLHVLCNNLEFLLSCQQTKSEHTWVNWKDFLLGVWNSHLGLYAQLWHACFENHQVKILALYQMASALFCVFEILGIQENSPSIALKNEICPIALFKEMQSILLQAYQQLTGGEVLREGLSLPLPWREDIQPRSVRFQQHFVSPIFLRYKNFWRWMVGGGAAAIAVGLGTARWFINSVADSLVKNAIPRLIGSTADPDLTNVFQNEGRSIQNASHSTLEDPQNQLAMVAVAGLAGIALFVGMGLGRYARDGVKWLFLPFIEGAAILTTAGLGAAISIRHAAVNQATEIFLSSPSSFAPNSGTMGDVVLGKIPGPAQASAVRLALENSGLELALSHPLAGWGATFGLLLGVAAVGCLGLASYFFWNGPDRHAGALLQRKETEEGAIFIKNALLPFCQKILRNPSIAEVTPDLLLEAIYQFCRYQRSNPQLNEFWRTRIAPHLPKNLLERDILKKHMLALFEWFHVNSVQENLQVSPPRSRLFSRAIEEGSSDEVRPLVSTNSVESSYVRLEFVSASPPEPEVVLEQKRRVCIIL